MYGRIFERSFGWFRGTTKEEQEVHDFFKAVAEGNIAVVKDLMSDSNVRARDKAGNYSLMIAVKTKNTLMAQELLRGGAYINAANNAGETPLILAIKEKDLPVVKILLNVKKVDINKPDKDGNTPLMHAINTHDIDIIKAILTEIPDPRIENKAGESAMDLAGTPQEKQLIKTAQERFRLFSMLDDIAKTGSKPTQVELANIEVFITPALLELDILLKLFRLAIASRNVDVVKSFVNKATEVNKDFINQILKDGVTPLLAAVDLIAREYDLKQDDFKIIEFLLEKGAKTNVVGPDGATPLMTALKWRKPEIIKLLVERGADINYQIPPNNMTLLMLAIEDGNVDGVKTILALNPDLSVQNSKGRTARDVADVTEEIIRAHGLSIQPIYREILDLIKEAAKMPKTPSTKPIITPPVEEPLISALQKLTQALNGVFKNILK